MATTCEQVTEILREMSESDRINPQMRFLIQLRKELVALDFPPTLAEVMATSLNVNIEDGSASPGEIEPLAHACARFFAKQCAILELNGFSRNPDVMLNLAKSFKLTIRAD